MTDTMKALAFVGTNRIEMIEKPIPEPGPNEAVVRTTASSVCTSDIHTLSGALAVPIGRVMGHESIGTVHRIGSEVRGFREGDRVAAPAVTSCGRCDYCQTGHPSQCGGALGGLKWTRERDGNLSEYFCVPDADYNLAQIPDSVPDDQALYVTDMFTTGLAAAEFADIPVGGTVAVLAQGPVGLCATLSARLLGAGFVVTTATRPERARLSRHFGADAVVDPRREDAVETIRGLVGQDGVDSAIEALGTPETFEQCVRVTKAGGTIANAGYHGWLSLAPLPIPVVSFGFGMGGKTIRAVPNLGGRERMTRLFRLMETGRVDLTPLTTHRIPFHDVTRAFDLMRTKSEQIVKPLITYGEGRFQ